MSLTALLTNEESSSSKKLEEVQAVVASARKAYGNVDMSITCPDVNTVDGLMSFAHMSDDSKVSMLKAEVQRIKIHAIEFAKNTEGANINRKLCELVATSPMLTSIENTVEFDYI